jgi:hypothetical protein
MNEQLKASPTPEQLIGLATSIVAKHPQIVQSTDIDLDDDLKIESLPLPDGIILDKPRLAYILVGSLATILLSQASSYQELSLNNDDTFEVGNAKQIDEDLRARLITIRPIGDIDYIPLPLQRRRIQAVNMPSTSRDRSWEPDKGNSNSVLKRVEFGSLPNTTHPAIKAAQFQTMEDGSLRPGSSMDIDQVTDRLPIDIIKISLAGQDFYINGPQSIFIGKFLHAIDYLGEDVVNRDRDKVERVINELALFAQIYSSFPPETQQVVLDNLIDQLKDKELAFKGSKTRTSGDFPYRPFVPKQIEKMTELLRTMTTESHTGKVLDLIDILGRRAEETQELWFFNGIPD